MKWRRIVAIARKEVIQIRRDPRSLLIAFLMPLIQLLIYGYAVNLDVKHVPLCVYDRDGTQDSQDLLKHFQATDYFNIVRVVGQLPRRDPPNRLWSLHGSRGRAAAVFGNASALAATRECRRCWTPATAIRPASAWAMPRLSFKAIRREYRLIGSSGRACAAGAPAVTFQPRTWFNEDLESMANLVPGVVALVMAVVGAFLTSLTIAREWERGTMEQLISTPVGKLEIQIGKLIPYFVLGMIDTVVCAGMSVWWFHVPFRGSWMRAVWQLRDVSARRAFAGVLHFGHGQVPSWREPDGHARHVPAHVPALGLHFPDRSNAGRRAVDHADLAGAVLRLDRAERVSQGHAGQLCWLEISPRWRSSRRY